MIGHGQRAATGGLVLGALVLVLARSAPAQTPELGRLAPGFTLPDLSGTSVRLEDFRGRKAVLINFWATWCAPCREEMPTLDRLAHERKERLAVLGVSVDTVAHERVRAFVQTLGLSFPILLDPDIRVGTAYRVRALPSSFILDREGVIRHREIGYRDWTSPESRYLVAEALRPR